ncbi:flagellar biosynthesis protein FlhF [Aquisalimonas sp. 2447]|uniref:flagellar biosynthesis protein FlhF n=1 Tax=Aquisalimonas sp. 2447 TaxID=2740807 RepID=UPI0014323471|nr:flagellar biosynthesis protein FlhF [Aquisalimonas sp. 2447]QIT55689.1 flagellar biosynthesis protein FlhF [Aquisalimonas sp. 2447]
MKIKRIHAKTMRQGIRRVRDEIGPQAVILSSRELDDGVEVIAALDFDEEAVREQAERDERRVPPAAETPAPRRREAPSLAEPADFAAMLERANDIAATREDDSGRQRIDVHVDDPLTEDDLDLTGMEAPRSHARPAPARPEPAPRRAAASRARPGREQEAATAAPRDDASVEAMRSELRTLRTLFENQLSVMEWQQQGRNRPTRTTLLRQLTEIGLGPDVCRKLADRVDESLAPDVALRQAMHTVARHLPVKKDDLLDRGGVVAVIGPTGVGKTTTVAKLAARFALRHGRQTVALVSTDNYRIGAQDQLRNFARILNVPVHTAGSTEELEEVLGDLADKRLVLVDTAGMSQRDMRLAEQFSTLKALGDRIRSYLVLSANTQLATLNETVKAYAGARPAGCIVTKTDEATSLGAVITVLLRQRLPVSFLGNGQRVPEDLAPARGDRLVQEAVGLVKQYGQAADDDQLAVAFGGGAGQGQ